MMVHTQEAPEEVRMAQPRVGQGRATWCRFVISLYSFYPCENNIEALYNRSGILVVLHGYAYFGS